MKLFRRSALSSASWMRGAALAAAALGLSVAASARAQEAAPADSAPACADANGNGVCDSAEKGDIIVTGSRIARPTLSSPVPVTTVNVAELTDAGRVSLGDALNDLPSLRSTFSSGSTARNIFSTSGLSLLDLRGLGTDRTLVLINGRRHVTASPGDNAFDVNTIPIDLVERIDVVTGGNSAIYGSDAVAGVVNFVMKRNYDGFAVRGQAGISARGDRGTAFLSAIYGQNFADGRGNVTVSAEYTRQNPLYATQRDKLTGAYNGRCQFQVTDNTAGEPAAGDGIFDRTFMCGIRNAAISDAGTVAALDGASSPLRRYLRFDEAGNVVIDTPLQSFSAVNSGNQQGGLGTTLFGTGQLLAAVDRYAFNLLAHYDVSDAFRPFVEAKYVRTSAFGEAQPSFFTSVNGSLGGPSIKCDNGFLSAQNLDALRANARCAGAAAGTTIAGSTTLRGLATAALPLARFNADFGGRIGKSTRETYRIVGGIEGTFNDDWRYEIAFNYGKFRGRSQSRNNLYLRDSGGNPDGFNLAVDAVIAPATFAASNFVLNSAGERVICRVNAVTNTRPDCLPVNVFGQNRNSRAVLDFIHRNGEIEEDSSQFVASAFVNGDLSQLFELPGGPISFALGAEYRREKDQVTIDALSKSGGTFLNALADFTPPRLTIKEAFGEILIPVLKDMPLAHELSLNLAGRVSDYNNSTGRVSAYNLQGIYAPLPDIRLRAAYATSVRAPTQGDLYSGETQSFAAVTDPCDALVITGNPNRARNCTDAGVPATANADLVARCAGTAFPVALGAPYINCVARQQTVRHLMVGNPILNEERGKSLTLGVVLEPRFIPGLNLTVDYYRIKVKNLIATPSLANLLSLCFDSSVAYASNPYCQVSPTSPTALLPRASSGLFGADAARNGGVNFAAQRTKGIDFDLSYRRTFDNGDRLSIRGIATRVRTLDNYVNILLPQEPNRQLSELGDPKWAANLQVRYDFGPVAVFYNARYIGKQVISAAYESQNAYLAACPASGVTPNTGGINGAAVPCTAGNLVRVAPNDADAFPVKNYPAVLYHDIRVDFELARKYNFYFGINNIRDRLPPLGELGNVAGSPYDSFGRYFFAGFKAEF
jgi:outer membrane receptor protein involved in Fe transport